MKINRFLDLIKILIKGIIGHIILTISFIIPRNNKKYLCGCYTGFADNPKYLFFELLKIKGIKAYWYTENKKEYSIVKNLGFPVVYKKSLKGIYHSLTTGNFVTSHNCNDYNKWLSGGARLISLWHGVGPKNMLAPPTKKNILEKIFNKIAYYNKPITIALSTSIDMTKIQHEAIGYKLNSVIYHTYPRCDFILKPHKEIYTFLQNINDIESLLLIDNISKYEKTFLYMPTWRDNGKDFIQQSNIDFKKLDKLLCEKKYLFLLKLHPNTKLEINSTTNYRNIKIVNNQLDIYPILPYISVLITDYSSIYYDFILMPEKEVIFFTFDLNDYLSTCRNFLMDFKSVTPGIHVDNFNQLYNLIENGESFHFRDRERIIDIFWGKAKTPIINELIKF